MTHCRPGDPPSASRRLISVEPSGTVWCVRIDGAKEAMTFESSWRAELAARALGRSLAETGYRCLIRIYVRGGAIAGEICCGPDEPLSH